MFKNAKFSTRPLYLQVRDALVQRIVLGEWKAGFALPNEFTLAQELGVSAGTIRKALDQLETEQIVLRKQGRGTFVNDQSSSEMAIRFSRILSPEGLRVEGRIVEKSVSRGLASEEEMRLLSLGRGHSVIRIERIHTYKDRPFMVESCRLPVHVFQSLPPDVGSYKICVLSQGNQVYLKSAREKVSAAMPTAGDAAELKIALNQPILLLERTIVAIDGRPVEWRRAVCAMGELTYVADIE